MCFLQEVIAVACALQRRMQIALPWFHRTRAGVLCLFMRDEPHRELKARLWF